MNGEALPPEGRYVHCPNGQTLHYLEQGEGAAVVFLHGSGPGASGYSNFKGNYPYFAEAGYRALVIDLVGFGYSAKPTDVDYTLAFFVECVKQTLDKAGVDRCAVVGNSLGGAVAVGLALSHPELVEKLILLAPGGMSPGEEYLHMPGMQKMFEVYAAPGPVDAAAMHELFAFGLVYDPSHITPALVAERLHVMALMNSHVMATLNIPYLPDQLHGLQCPSLVFWGASERMMPESGILAMASHCPRMKLVLLSECGHWVMVEYEALFNRESLRFLAGEL